MTKMIVAALSLLLPIHFSFAHGIDAEAKETYHWMKFSAKNKYERTEIANLGVSIEAIVEDHVMAIGTIDQLQAAKKSGKLIMDFPLTGKLMDFPAEDSKFHNYSELWQGLQALANDSGGIAKLSALGRSVEGRDIPLLTISVDGQDT